jgi:WD40 repeat protein
MVHFDQRHVTCVCASHETLVVGSADGTLSVWSFLELCHPSSVSAASISALSLSSSFQQRSTRRVDECTPKMVLLGHRSPLVCVTASDDLDIVLSASTQMCIVHALHSGHVIATLDVPHVTAVAIAQIGLLFVAAASVDRSKTGQSHAEEDAEEGHDENDSTDCGRESLDEEEKTKTTTTRLGGMQSSAATRERPQTTSHEDASRVSFAAAGIVFVFSLERFACVAQTRWKAFPVTCIAIRNRTSHVILGGPAGAIVCTAPTLHQRQVLTHSAVVRIRVSIDERWVFLGLNVSPAQVLVLEMTSSTLS